VTYHPAVVVDLPGGMGAGWGAGGLRARLLRVHLVEAGLSDGVLLVVEPSVLSHSLLSPAGQTGMLTVRKFLGNFVIFNDGR
jgi:hypothetical protein